MPRWTNYRILIILRAIRENPDKSDSELAKQLEVSTRTISRYRKLLNNLPTE